MGQETTMLAPDDTFLTPDAALWAIDGRGLWSFRAGHWSVVLEGSGPRTGLGFVDEPNRCGQHTDFEVAGYSPTSGQRRAPNIA
jgi:hypothetical protein